MCYFLRLLLPTLVTEDVRVITSLPYDMCRHSFVILHHFHMVLDTPDECRMETMAIDIISNITPIVSMGNIANIYMVGSIEAMAGIDSRMMIG